MLKENECVKLGNGLYRYRRGLLKKISKKVDFRASTTEYGVLFPALDALITADEYTAGEQFNIRVIFTGEEWTPELKTLTALAAEHLSYLLHTDIQAEYDIGDRKIDDIEVVIEVSDIDGAGGVLGSAGPRYLHPDTKLPMTAAARFDIADIGHSEPAYVFGVMFHELCHCVGHGPLTKYKNLLHEEDGKAFFTGENAVAAYQEWCERKGMTPDQRGVPLENGGGVGTAKAHWSEAIFDKEVMTGYADAGMYYSDITHASWRDYGYVPRKYFVPFEVVIFTVLEEFWALTHE